MKFAFAIASVVVLLNVAVGPVPVRAPQQRPEFTDIEGKRQTPLHAADGTLHLLVFIAADCPISNRYAPEISRIAARYSSKPVRTFLIYPDRAVTVAAVREHQQQFFAGTKATVLIDTNLLVTLSTSVRVTPEAAVVRGHSVVYRGRIDDRQISLSEERREPTTRDLRNALDALVSGKEPESSVTDAVGCYIDLKGR